MARRLAAILIADVVDYSRLMGDDEARTLAALAELRQELFEPVVAKRSGKVIKRMGDGWIVEYPNVSDAVASAIEVQEGLSEHEIIRLRIGVHIGDVTFQDEDVYGDGINVAARLEAMAKSGQVLISDTAHQSLDGKAAMQFVGGESHELKNISRPVAVWQWPAASDVIAPASTALALPDKPSIAVLPFDNMSGDPEQEYFSDGISEDIITALSQFKEFHVIARNSTFTYKGQAIDIKKVGEELGVRYVLEGSVRKAGSRVRITAQLIEAVTGNHVWADRYDRELVDIFDLQDEITSTIASALFPAFETAELQRINRVRPENLIAWDLTLQASHFASRATREDLLRGRELAQKAVELEPNNSQALAILSYSIGWQVGLGFSSAPMEDRDIGIRLANRALQIDPLNAVALRSVGGHFVLARRFEEALDALKRCVRQNPNFEQGWLQYAAALALCGRYEEAIDAYERGMKLSPRDPIVGLFTLMLANGAFAVERYGDGLDYADQALRQLPGYLGIHRTRAANLSALGRMDEAVAAVNEARRFEPSASIASVRARMTFDKEEVLDRYCDALRRGGLPEE